MENIRLAAIDIGSSAIRMTIAEIVNKKLNILEELNLSIKLGRDTFNKGKISRSTIDETIKILKKYKLLCEQYKVNKIKAVATTAVRESSNVDIFIDNIKNYVGLDIEILSYIKESEYIYKALKNTIIDYDTDIKDYHGIIEIGAGNVELTIFNKDLIIFSRSLPLGTLKMREIFTKVTNIDENFINYLRVMIDHQLRDLSKDIPMKKLKSIYGIGSELEILVSLQNNKNKIPKIDLKKLDELLFELESYTEEEIIHKLKIPYNYGETFYSVLLIFNKIINFFDCSNIYVPNVSLRDGIIQNMIEENSDISYYEKLENQIKINALNIGRNLKFDETHAIKVMELSLKLFDNLTEIHKLGNKERFYLIVASLLHDVGSIISKSSHHKHSLYIIKSQNFFYFNDTEKNIIANIARYHRRSMPKTTHPDFISLSYENRMIVMKLASLLRIADSLDNTCCQNVIDIDIEIEDNKVILNLTIKDNIYGELYSFKYKRDLFEEFFGYDIKIKIKRRKNEE